MARIPALAAVAALALSACGGGAGDDAAWPALLPLGPLVSATAPGTPPFAAPGVAAVDAARLAGLRARGESLRRPVLTEAERARLTGGLSG